MISFPIQIKLDKKYPKVVRGLYFNNIDDILKNKKSFLLSNFFERTKPMCICSTHVFGIIFLGTPQKEEKDNKEILWKYPIKNIIILDEILPAPLPHKFRVQKVL